MFVTPVTLPRKPRFCAPRPLGTINTIIVAPPRLSCKRKMLNPMIFLHAPRFPRAWTAQTLGENVAFPRPTCSRAPLRRPSLRRTIRRACVCRCAPLRSHSAEAMRFSRRETPRPVAPPRPPADLTPAATPPPRSAPTHPLIRNKC